MTGRREWLVPLLGVLFFAVAVAAFAVGGQPPEAKDGGAKIIRHYVDHKDSIQISSLLVGIAAVLIVFFFGYVRKVLRAAEGEGGMLSALPLIGAAIFAAGVAFDATIAFALAEAAKDIRPAAAQAVETIWDNDFLPMMVGTVVILFSVGISIVRYGALPKWLGWVAIVLGVAGMTPVGFAAFIGLGIWILVVSVLLSIRARRAAATPSPPAVPA